MNGRVSSSRSDFLGLEQPCAASDHNREDEQPVLVDQACGDQCLDELHAAGGDDVATGRGLQCLHFRDEVTAEDGGVLPARVADCARDDVLAYAVEVVGHTGRIVGLLGPEVSKASNVLRPTSSASAAAECSAFVAMMSD